MEEDSNAGFVEVGRRAPRVIRVLSSVLQRVVASNEREAAPAETHYLTVFHGLRSPSIGIDKYLERILKYANCSPSCFVVAYAYIHRLMCQHPITSFNVHRLIITSVMLAAKYLDDAYYNNAYYAKVGGVTTMEMNWLEVQFLFGLGFRLHVTVNDFEKYCRHLQKEAMFCECYQIERPILQSGYGCALVDSSVHDKARSQRQQQQPQGMTVYCSYAAMQISQNTVNVSNVAVDCFHLQTHFIEKLNEAAAMRN